MGQLRKLKREKKKGCDDAEAMIAKALYTQVQVLGLDANEMDPDDIVESKVSGGGQTVRHFHYKNLLLVEQIKRPNGKIETNVPKIQRPKEVGMEAIGAAPA